MTLLVCHEAGHLILNPNCLGIEDFCQRYGDKILQQQIESGGPIALEGETLHIIQKEIEKRIPLDKIEERRNWRDDRLTEIFRLKLQEKKKCKETIDYRQ